MLRGFAYRLNSLARRVARVDRDLEYAVWHFSRRFPIGRSVFSWKALGRPDYSWKNLCEHSVGECSLEEYWRRDPISGTLRDDAQMGAELVRSSDGILWHAAHLPLRWRGRSEKNVWTDAQWSFLENIVESRLHLAGPTLADRETNAVTSGHECRALFDGVTLRFLQKTPTRLLHVSCANATFQGAAFCDGARFGAAAWFEGAQFLDTIDLVGARFEGTANFDDSYFLKQARVDDAHFVGEVTFRRAIFREGASFFKAHFLERTRFSGAKFHSAAEFCEVEFREPVHISGTQFFHTSSFPKARFAKNAKIHNVRFRGAADFKGAIFETSASFQKCSFDAPVEFEDATLPTDSTFDRARFGVVDSVSRPAQLVAWVVFAGTVLMYLASGTQPNVETGALAFGPWAIWLMFGGAVVAQHLDLERVARSFRTLTQHAVKFNNRKDAGRFLRQDMRATRLRWNINPIERFVSYLFDATASYGFSIARPVAALLTSTVLFACLFAHWDRADLFNGNPGRETEIAAATDEAIDHIGALQLSGGNILAPFALWAVAPTRPLNCDLRARLTGQSLAPAMAGKKPTLCRSRWMGGMKPTGMNAHVLRVQIVGAIQSFLSIYFLFSAGLALRRRFQIA